MVGVGSIGVRIGTIAIRSGPIESRISISRISIGTIVRISSGLSISRPLANSMVGVGSIGI